MTPNLTEALASIGALAALAAAIWYAIFSKGEGEPIRTCKTCGEHTSGPDEICEECRGYKNWVGEK